MNQAKTIELSVAGMDCAHCALAVHEALVRVPGVAGADVLLGAEKAVVQVDPSLVDVAKLRRAVEGAGYTVPKQAGGATLAAQAAIGGDFTRRVLTFFALVFGVVLLIVVAGEWLGLFANLTALVPFWLGALLVLISGWSIFAAVARSAWRRRVTSHTLMTLGVLAALAVGQWVTAAVVVFFMRVGDYAERFTAEGARRAVKELAALAPKTARVLREDSEVETPIDAVQIGDVVVVRPGELIPVDGEVIAGHATIDQATITGESVPADVGPGVQVYAATIAQLGSLRVRTVRVGPDTTYGRIVKLVEDAEAHRADVQLFADKFSGYYLPIVGGVALLTFLISRNPLATAAVLVVACSCSIALATPIAMLASIGAAARHGLLIKGSKYLETLAKADVLLIDKTGTLTLGRPQIADVIPLDGLTPDAALQLAASAERYSEHPLATALRAAAEARGLPLAAPDDFTALPGIGVQATVGQRRVDVGNRRLVPVDGAALPGVAELAAQGKTLLYLACDGTPAAVFAAADTLRPEVPAALAQVRRLGIVRVELLTGDQERTAATLAGQLGIPFRAGLLPEDKIAIVKEYQARGHTVVMVGDGVNDAPALAQADVGIAMGAAGADIALEAAHIALLRDDWLLVPAVVDIARRTMRVVKLNLLFTGVYNLVGLSLAAFGYLPPMLAAAAQSIPDLGILANSARLLRQKVE